MLFGAELPEVRRNLYVLMNNVINLAPYLGKAGFARNGYDGSQAVLLRQTQNTLALTGLLFISA